jgi:hypothetical protein
VVKLVRKVTGNPAFPTLPHSASGSNLFLAKTSLLGATQRSLPITVLFVLESNGRDFEAG